MIISRTLGRVLIFMVVLACAISACEKAKKAKEETEEVTNKTEEAVNGKNIVGEEVEYSSNGTTFKGYLAYDKNIEGKRPGVLVVHEWWGLNDYARKRANMLAELGYTALAVDMYGEGKHTTDPNEAGKLSSMVMSNMDDAQARFTSAMELLRNNQTVDPEHVAAIGYCFGGGVVLNMALRGVDLDGVVSFHGALPTSAPVKPGEVKADVLVFHGGQDQFVSDKQVEKFKEMMKKANANFEVIVYPNAKHSFTVPEANAYAEKFGIPIGYDEQADKGSWEKMKEFFKRIFGKES